MGGEERGRGVYVLLGGLRRACGERRFLTLSEVLVIKYHWHAQAARSESEVAELGNAGWTRPQTVAVPRIQGKGQEQGQGHRQDVQGNGETEAGRYFIGGRKRPHQNAAKFLCVVLVCLVGDRADKTHSLPTWLSVSHNSEGVLLKGLGRYAQVRERPYLPHYPLSTVLDFMHSIYSKRCSQYEIRFLPRGI